MADRLTANSGRFLYARKAERWAGVHESVRRSLIEEVAGSDLVFDQHPRGLVFDAHDVGADAVFPLRDLARPPGYNVFIVQVGHHGLFLVNTEGYDYCRYVSKVVDG
jgi:hypothetical protein